MDGSTIYFCLIRPAESVKGDAASPCEQSNRMTNLQFRRPSGLPASFGATNTACHGIGAHHPLSPLSSSAPSARPVDGRRDDDDGVLAGVLGFERRARVRGGRGRRHGGGAGGAPAGHAPHPAAAAAAAARQPRHRRRAAPPALRRAPPPRHPPSRGPRRALPRHGRAPRIRRRPERDGLPSVRHPVPVSRPRELHNLRAAILRERGARRRRHGGTADAHPIPGGARQDPPAAGGGGPQAPASRRPPRPGRHGPRHPPARGPPRHLPRAHGDRAPRRAGPRRLLLDLRVGPGAAAPGLPPPRRREPGHHARLRRPRRSHQLGLLLPARRRQVAAAGAGVVVGHCKVQRRRGLLQEERQGGGAPRAVARPGHSRGTGVRCEWRHLLGVRACSEVLGQWRRAEDGHGGELNSTVLPGSATEFVHATTVDATASVCKIVGASIMQRHVCCIVHRGVSIHLGFGSGWGEFLRSAVDQ